MVDYTDFARLANQAYTGAVANAQQQDALAQQKAAGAAYASGDSTTAAKLLARSGDIAGARQLTSFQNQDADRASKIASATAYAKGDYAGAAQGAAAAGDIGQVAAIQDQGAQQFTRQHQYLGQALPVLTKAQQAGQLPQAIDALHDDLVGHLGMTQAEFDGLKAHAAADPNATLGAIGSTVQKKWSFQKVGDDTYAVNEADPTEKTLVGKAPHIVTLNRPGGGQDVVAIDPDAMGSGGAMGGGGQAATPDGGASAPVAGGNGPSAGYFKRLAQVESSGNATAHNPIAGSTSAGLYGFTKGTGAKYGLPADAATATPEQQTAAVQQLTADNARQLQASGVPITDGTLYLAHQQGPGAAKALLNAPEGTTAVQALQSAGLSPGNALAAVMGNLPTSMRANATNISAQQFAQLWTSKFDGGQGAPAAAPQSAGVVGPGVRVLASTGTGGPAYRPATAAEIKAYGLPDGTSAKVDAKGDLTILQKADDKTADDIPNIQGPALLAALDPKDASMAKALVEGRMAFPTGAALRSPFWQKQLQIVSQVDPNFDAVNYNARAKTRAGFTQGKQADNIASFNTAIGHLGELNDSIGVLAAGEPFGGAIPFLNAGSNAVGKQLGNTNISDFEAKKTAVAEELTRAFRGAGGTGAEVEGLLGQLQNSATPGQLRTTVKAFANLLGDRIQALTDQYNTGMGTTADAPPGVRPKTLQILQRLQGRASAPVPQAGRQADPLGIR